MLLPADVVAASPAPFADALVSRWGHGVAVLAALAIAISAIGCLNGLILGTGELGYSMALRGDLPASNGPDPRRQHAGRLAIGRSGPDHPAAARQQQPGHRQPVHFHHLAFDGGARSSSISSAHWRPGSRARRSGARSIIVVALLFIAFATYGIGLEAGPVVPGAVGRRPGHPGRDAAHQFPRVQPGAGGRSSRASGMKPAELPREAPEANLALAQRPGDIGRAGHAVLDAADQLGVLGIDPAVDAPVQDSAPPSSPAGRPGSA